MALMHPRRVGNYHLICPVGQGGLAEVYLALRNGKPFAVKCLKTERTADERFIRDFMREAMVSTTLEHPNILKFLDQGKADDTYFAAMELIVGTTLEQVLVESKKLSAPCPVSFSLFCIAELIKALKYLHQSTVFEYSNSVLFHGDISPNNVMVCQDGRVLLMDFGSAGQQSETYPKDHHLGKMCYLPPDILQKVPYTTAADVYSAGVLAFYLLFGRRPFEAATKLELYRSILRDPLPRLDLNGIARSLKDEGPIRIFFNQALHKDPKLRFATIQDFEKQFLSLRFARPAPQTPSEFLRTFPEWLSGRFNDTAREWMKRIQDYRAGETRALAPTAPQAHTPVQSLLAGIEKRRHPRISVEHRKLTAEIISPEERVKVKASVAELSRGGMLVKWEGLRPKVGQVYPLRFRLEEHGVPIQAAGRLLYEVQRKEKPYVGMEFTRMAPEHELRLAEFVSSHIPTSPSFDITSMDAGPEASETYVDVVFRSAEDFRVEYETNMRHGGMFVQSTRSFKNHETVLLRIQVGNHLERVTLKASVVYSKALEASGAPNARFGLGVQLSDPPAKLESLFGRFLPAVH
jgi:serine/threonine protein kinase/Tfp pilus assembly protein PilZ